VVGDRDEDLDGAVHNAVELVPELVRNEWIDQERPARLADGEAHDLRAPLPRVPFRMAGAPGPKSVVEQLDHPPTLPRATRVKR
jgi:hypothetical protein